MVRLRQKSGWTLLLVTGLCLTGQKSVAQGTPPAATAARQSKANPHRRKAIPDPPAQQTPAPPPTLEQTPPTPPQVTYNSGQLTIIAQNATLSQVLRMVQSQTGASIEIPPGASSERVVGQLGPGQPRDVLNSLLNGSRFNYIILGVAGNPGAVQKVILTTSKPSSPVNTAQNNAVQPPEEAQDEENDSEQEPQAAPQPPLSPQSRRRLAMPGRIPEVGNQPPTDNSGDSAQPNGAKTPEQLLQELQQMQQQQQQMQEQLNPANRQQQ